MITQDSLIHVKCFVSLWLISHREHGYMIQMLRSGNGMVHINKMIIISETIQHKTIGCCLQSLCSWNPSWGKKWELRLSHLNTCHLQGQGQKCLCMCTCIYRWCIAWKKCSIHSKSCHPEQRQIMHWHWGLSITLTLVSMPTIHLVFSCTYRQSDEVWVKDLAIWLLWIEKTLTSESKTLIYRSVKLYLSQIKLITRNTINSYIFC